MGDNNNSKTIDNNSGGGRGFASHPENINRKGRPPRGWTWVDLLEEVGEEVEEKTGKKYKHLVSKRLWVECANGNISAIKELMNRTDGLPKQVLDIKGGFFSKDELKIKIIEAKKYAEEPSPGEPGGSDPEPETNTDPEPTG